MTANLPDPQHPFARTNVQTIRQRAGLLRELLPQAASIAEICCGDCAAQHAIYRALPGIQRYHGLDLSPQIVAQNRARGIACELGNALDPAAMRPFAADDVIFFGPPLSVGCDGHRLIAFREVVPGFWPFTQLLLGELNYQGLLVLIGPRTTSLGDVQWIEHKLRAICPEYGLRLLHYSHATLTGAGETTEPRLKYVELWFQPNPSPPWEVRESNEQTPN